MKGVVRFFLLLLLSALLGVVVTQSVTRDETTHQSNSPGSKSGGKDDEEKQFIPLLPELSKSIKDPKRWRIGTRVMLFYTPWCEHSIEAMGHLYEMMAMLYQNNITGVNFGKVDVSLNPDISKAFFVSATPTLLYFQNGSRYEFSGNYTAERMSKFLFSLFRPPVMKVTTLTEIAAVQTNHSVVFLLVCLEEDDVDQDWTLMYQRVAKDFITRTKHVTTNNTELLSELGFPSVLTSPPGVVVLKDNAAYRYKEKLSRYLFSTWVQREQFNALPTVNMSTFYPYIKLSLGRRILLVFVNVESSRSITEKKAVEAARKVAESRKLLPGYQFVLTQDQELVEKMVRHSMEIQQPTVIVWEPGTGLFYPYSPVSEEAPFSSKSITTFILSISNGKIPAQGGLTYMNMIEQLYIKAVSIIRGMMIHYPVLSIVGFIAAPISSIFFCYNIFCRKYNTTKPTTARGRALLQKKKKKDEEVKRREQENEGVRWRGNQPHNRDDSDTKPKEDDKNK